MKEKLKKYRRLRRVFHILGFSSIGGAVFLQILVFADIATKGYFFALEHNKLILSLEIALTIFVAIYFLYAYQNFIRRMR